MAKTPPQHTADGRARPAGPLAPGSRTRWLLKWALLAAGLVWVGVEANVTFSPMDEGKTLTYAWLVSEGAVPYRDFFDYYAPGYWYLLAALFKLFGVSILTDRILSLAGYVLLFTGVWACSRRLAPASVALAVTAYIATWLTDFHGLPMLQVTGLLLWVAALAHDDMGKPSVARRLGIAALLGLAGLLRHDTAIVALVLTLAVMAGRCRFGEGGGPSWGRIARELGAIPAAWLCIVAPVAVYFLALVPLKTLLYELVYFPLAVYPRVRRLPIPAPPGLPGGAVDWVSYVADTCIRLSFYVPFAALLLAAVVLRARGRERWRDGRRAWLTVLLSLLLVSLLPQYLTRGDQWHLMPVLAMSCPLFAATAACWVERRRRLAAGCLIALGLFLSTEPLMRKANTLAALAHPSWRFESSLPRARGIWMTKTYSTDPSGRIADCELYDECLRYVRERVPPGERIFVGSPRYDRATNTDELFYFLAERKSPTAYDQIHPGLVTRRDVQEEIVHDLETHHVRCLVTWNVEPDEPNDSAISSGVHVLDDYVGAHFTPDRDFGPYSVWKRK